ncbi:MAG: hypothetical protein M3158_10090 [Pseudomonadota bacterium]|nr:hypothetical protein [Pseudomonadota bacterium]
MRHIFSRGSFSPAVRAEMIELGLLRSKGAAGPVLLISIAFLDITTTVLSLAAR